MDVNQTSAIAPVHQDAKKPHQHRDQDDHHDDQDAQNGSQSGSWRDLDAVDVDASLVNGMNAETQDLIDTLNRQIEPLRAELELAKRREAHFCDLAAEHSFLDIPCRREFLRELTHVLTHTDHLTVPPSMIMLHVTGTEEVRLSAGRLGLDQILLDVSGVVSNLLQPTDIIGSLGGADFGVILLSGDENSAAEVVSKLADSITNRPFVWAGQVFDLGMKAGWSLLQAEESADAVMDTADRMLRS